MPDAEILYYRLLVSVDDFGRIDARPLVIKSACFPIRMRATADKCMQWMQELEKANLIGLYMDDGKPYLYIKKWENKARAKHSKYPEPPTDADKCIHPFTFLPETVTVTGTDIPSTHKPNKRAYKRAAIPPAFDAFWKAYPRKIAKQDALTAWNKIAPTSELVDRILAAVDEQKRSDQWRGGTQYIPYPATWLNGGRWDDEPPLVPEKKVAL